MTTLTIKDLTVAEEMTPSARARVHGGIYRTPPQILAHELTGLPATPDGRVLGPDGRLYPPGLQPLPHL
jgi:hypothetical protein